MKKFLLIVFLALFGFSIYAQTTCSNLLGTNCPSGTPDSYASFLGNGLTAVSTSSLTFTATPTSNGVKKLTIKSRLYTVNSTDGCVIVKLTQTNSIGLSTKTDVTIVTSTGVRITCSDVTVDLLTGSVCLKICDSRLTQGTQIYFELDFKTTGNNNFNGASVGISLFTVIGASGTNITCPATFICLNDPTNCSPCDPNFTVFSGKIRVFFSTPIPIGVATPTVIAALDASGTLLSRFKFCVSADAGSINVVRNYVDYCVYTDAAGSLLPAISTFSSLSLTLQSGNLEAITCLITTNNCPTAFSLLPNTSNCVDCNPGDGFDVLSGKIRIFFSTPIPIGAPTPTITATALVGIAVTNFRLCAAADAGSINVVRNYVDYCVYTNVLTPLTDILSFNLILTSTPPQCITSLPCMITKVDVLPCITSFSVLATADAGTGSDPGGNTAGCPNRSQCNGQLAYFTSKLRVNFSPCLPATLAAPTISSITTVDASGRLITYCFVISDATAAGVGTVRCYVDYCVYATVGDDTYLSTLLSTVPLTVTFTVLVNNVLTPLTQRCEPPSNIPLPVDFTSITASRNQQNIFVKWETATESNNRGFNVQRNLGNSWENVGYVSSKAQGGNSSSLISYSFVDVNTSKGVSQYRVQQVDLDGKTKYSEIRSVRGLGLANKIIVYPNPSNDGKVSIVFEDNSTVKDVQVMDMSGRLIRQYKRVNNGSMIIDNLMSGIYSIHIVDLITAESYKEKIIVQRR